MTHRLGPALAAALCALTISGLAAGAPARSAPGSFTTRLPIVLVEVHTPVPDARKAAGRMRIVHRGGGRPNRPTSPPRFSGAIGIETRGSSSLDFPKKSYAVETRTAKGKNLDVSLLGLPKENDWVLHAPYSDKTLMRDVLAYRTARMLGRYATRTVYVELFLNGRYQGVYVLMEKPKLDRNRVDAAKRDITGRYLVELTTDAKLKPADRVFRTPVTRRPVIYADPKASDMPKARELWIRDYVAGFERVLYADGEYRRYLDVSAAVDYAIVQELFKNEDAFKISTFAHKGSGGKLVLGPVWDFDISAGNSNYGPSSTLPGWVGNERVWAERLYADPAFAKAFADRWRALRRAGLLQQVLRRLDATAATLRGPQARNFARWRILGKYVRPNPVDPATGKVRQTWRAEVAYLRSWLVRRAAWIDANLDTLGARNP